MADSLFSDAEKQNISDTLDIVFDTFKTRITIYKVAEKVFISSTNQYNSIYQDLGGNDVNYEIVSQSFDATVQFFESNSSSKNKIDRYPSDRNARYIVEGAELRISVRQDAYEYMKNFQAMEFNGEKFALVTSDVPRGIFSMNYYNFWLKRER